MMHGIEWQWHNCIFSSTHIFSGCHGHSIQFHHPNQVYFSMPAHPQKFDKTEEFGIPFFCLVAPPVLRSPSIFSTVLYSTSTQLHSLLYSYPTSTQLYNSILFPIFSTPLSTLYSLLSTLYSLLSTLYSLLSILYSLLFATILYSTLHLYYSPSPSFLKLRNSEVSHPNFLW